MKQLIYAATIHASKAHLVGVESRSDPGLSRVIMVGMPDTVAKESRERLPAAMKYHGYAFPRGKVLFNLFPAQIPKRGVPIDLALTTSLLVEEQYALPPRKPTLFLAELDLQGRLHPPAYGTLLASLEAVENNMQIVTAHQAANEAALAPGAEVYSFSDLKEVVAFLNAQDSHLPIEPKNISARPTNELRLDEIRGQQHAHNAAALCAVGRHSLWLQGPPGTGKSMLAQRVIRLLPDLPCDTAMQLARVEALLGPITSMPRRPPFRSPHTTTSAQGLLGGGSPLRPGEMSRAHGGILFLDEMPEFTRPALEGMRQPLEEKEVRLQRAQDWAKYPADVIMLATSNPCPCGYLSHPKIPCRCSETRIETYLSRVSGPLQDRFDLFVEMGPVAADVLDGPATAQSDEDVIARITAAKEFQRSKDRVFTCSNEASLAQIIEAGILPEAQTQMRKASTLLALSGRAVLRCLRVARSNADLNQRAAIALEDVQQALSFRPLSAQQKTTTDKHRLAQRLKTHHPSRATYSNNRDSPSKSPYSK